MSYRCVQFYFLFIYFAFQFCFQFASLHSCSSFFIAFHVNSIISLSIIFQVSSASFVSFSFIDFILLFHGHIIKDTSGITSGNLETFCDLHNESTYYMSAQGVPHHGGFLEAVIYTYIHIHIRTYTNKCI